MKTLNLRENAWFLVLFIVYAPMILAQNPANPDATVILQNLRDFGTALDYLRGLITFQTIDFQPIRDLTLFLDLLFARIGLNTIVFQNVLWWIGSLFIVKRILTGACPGISSRNILLLTLLFGAYPLFTSSISWGMNRKHLVAFFFILVATHFWISDSRGSKWYSILAYACSVLSQPITLLWPFFAFCWSGLKEKKFLSILILIMASVIAVNVSYYRTSEVFRFIYPPKEDPLSLPDMLLAWGHYQFQLVFPFLLSFRYTLGHWSVLPGLAMGGGLILLGVRKIKDRNSIAWILFGVLPLLIVLRDPQTLSDAYLLCPALAALIFITKSSAKIPPRTLLILVILAAGFTAYESSHWQSRLKLARVTFERRPDCGGAFNYMRTSYDAFTKAPIEARTYVAENDCYQRMRVTPFMYRSMVLVSANAHFYETDLPLDERIARLIELASQHPLAHINLIGLLLQNGDTENARREAENLQRWLPLKITPEYHAVSAQLVHPFCVKEKIEACVTVTSQLLNERD